MKIKNLIPLFLLLISSNLQAQQQNGRLPDGRPYRVDQQGMRLSDYIAEIEVTNEELRRQVTGLEDELAQANRKLSGQNGIVPAKEPQQAITVTTNSTELSKLQSDNQLLKEQILSLSQQLRASFVENSNLTKQLQTNIAQNENLSKQLQMSLNDKENLYQDLINKNKDSEDTFSQVKNDNIELKQKISKLENDLLNQNQNSAQLKNTIEKLQQAYNEEASTAKNNNEDLLSLRNQLQEKEYEIATLKSTINSQDQRAALAYKEKPITNPANTNTSPQADKTLTSYKSELRGQLQKIQSLILQRKNALDNLKNKKTGVLVSIQPLVTSSGTSLDKIRIAVDALNNEDEVSNIKSELSEISKILTEDIEVINRLIR